MTYIVLKVPLNAKQPTYVDLTTTFQVNLCDTVVLWTSAMTGDWRKMSVWLEVLFTPTTKTTGPHHVFDHQLNLGWKMVTVLSIASITCSLHREMFTVIQGSNASWKVLDLYSKLSSTWNVSED